MSIATLVIGLGQIGMGYDLELDTGSYVLSHSRAFAQHRAFHLVGGVDVSAERRGTFERTFQCSAYETIDTALEAHQPELVVIALPTALHGDMLRRILNRASFPKAILCEKPLSYDLDEAADMVRTCEERGVRLYVNYMRRCDPAVIEIRRRIDAGEINLPVKGIAWYSKGFYHNGSHFFNLLEYWLGAVKGVSIVNRSRVLDVIDPEPDVQANFNGGTIMFLAAREENFSYHAIEMLASNGRLRYERGGRKIEWAAACSEIVGSNSLSLSQQSEMLPSGLDRYQWHVTEELAKALQNAPASLCTGKEALLTLSNMKRILQ